jgi:hypothetical protein
MAIAMLTILRCAARNRNMGISGVFVSAEKWRLLQFVVVDLPAERLLRWGLGQQGRGDRRSARGRRNSGPLGCVTNDALRGNKPQHNEPLEPTKISRLLRRMRD